jgi:putative CocE/NonD family hydrolase
MKSRLVLLAVSVVALSGLGPGSAPRVQPSQRPGSVEARYKKYEFRIPMRDGVQLFTAIYVPRDGSVPHPFLVTRTPFSVAPYGSDRYPARLGPSEQFEQAGYIFVQQDARGRFQSEGTFVDARPHIDDPRPGQTDESTDMHDTVDWLLAHVPNNNGNVGLWGMSYPGFYTSASIIDSHPAIKAASPQAPVTDLFRGDDAYHNGAFMLAAQFLYASVFRVRPAGPDLPGDFQPFDYGTNDGSRFFLQHGPDLNRIAAAVRNPVFATNIAHNTYDEYWQSRDISRHLHNIRCAVLNVAGWFDAEDLAGPFRTYRAIEERNPGIVNVLVAGPWEHGAWLRLRAGAAEQRQLEAAVYFRERILFPFFEHYLNHHGDVRLPEATVFDTGTNEWRSYDVWPPAPVRQRTLYLRGNRKLSFEPPAAGEAPYDEYVSDPQSPVPYVPIETTDLIETYMFGDQTFASKRPDVLTYVSDPLTEDLTVVGPVAPRLHVSSSGTDSDFDVKLIDLFPGEPRAGSNPLPDDVPVASPATAGYAQLIRGEPMRARFRESWSTPRPLVAGETTAVNFDMPDVHHTFRRGHRIMVQIQSSWFPLTDLNPQSFVDPATATRADFVKAVQRVYHQPAASSGVVLSVLQRP